MGKKPWTFAEGFLIGGGLVAVGLLLQCLFGPIDWKTLAWPVNILLLALFLLLVDGMFLLRRKVYAFEWMMHYRAAVPALACALSLTILMGLTVQTDRGGIPGLSQMVTFWPFVLVYAWVMVIAALATLGRLSRWKLSEIPFLLNHLGVFLAITCATLGSADLQRLQMTVQEGQAQWQAADEDGAAAEPGLAIALHAFTIDAYPPQLMLRDEASGRLLPARNPASVVLEEGVTEGRLGDWEIRVLEAMEDAAPVPSDDGTAVYEGWEAPGSAPAALVEARKDGGPSLRGWVSCGSHAFPSRALDLGEGKSIVMPAPEPRRYASLITVHTPDGKEVGGTVEVNKPLKVNGWKIYQYSYDERLGKWSDVSVFELVRDPWLPAVYTGIFLMLAGAACLFLLMAPKPMKKEGKR